jgi:hypothetical protein
VVLSYAHHVYKNPIIASVKTKKNVVLINVSMATSTKSFIKICSSLSMESFSKFNQIVYHICCRKYYAKAVLLLTSPPPI